MSLIKLIKSKFCGRFAIYGHPGIVFFNCYRLFFIVLWNGNGTASFMYSREGMKHRWPLSIVAYFSVVLPLIKRLKLAYHGIIQPWYADNSGTLGTFDNIGLYFNSLKWFGTVRGYYPEHSKRVLIVHSYNLTAREDFGLLHGFKVFTGARYLGGFIGDDESKRDCLEDQTSKWEKKLYDHQSSGELSQDSYAVVVFVINRNGYFCNMWRKTWDTHSRGWRKFFREPFCLIFSSENQNISYLS